MDGAVAILREAGLRPQVAPHPWRRALGTSRRGGGLLPGPVDRAVLALRADGTLASIMAAHDPGGGGLAWD